VNDERLEDAFDRGLANGLETLSPADQDLYRVQDFIIDYEMGGLTGFFYNRLPDIAVIKSAAIAMRRLGLKKLAGFLEQAIELFVDYVDPEQPTTWECVLQIYDPKGQLQKLDKRIEALDNYGIG